MKQLLVCCLLAGFLTFGCSMLRVTTTIKTPGGQMYVVKSKSDALVELSKDGVKVIVDNRGRPSFLETFFSTLIMRSPQVHVGDGD